LIIVYPSNEADGPHYEIKSGVFTTTACRGLSLSRRANEEFNRSELFFVIGRSGEILTACYPTASSDYELRSMDQQALVAE